MLSGRRDDGLPAPGHVVVGPNLAHDCRVTELRFWACARKVNTQLTKT